MADHVLDFWRTMRPGGRASLMRSTYHRETLGRRYRLPSKVKAEFLLRLGRVNVHVGLLEGPG
jgi:hypothetical protein